MLPSPVDAQKITRQSKSNLALAFVSLGGERRRGITTFYAFCRVIDDIADSSELSVAQKREGLSAWRRCLRGATTDEPALAGEVRALMTKYRLSPEMLEEIISGVEMDLTISRYATFEDLRLYCYRVASAVGLVSIEVFGYRNAQCREYAIELGLALQTTNIIRDVAKDLDHGRIYLPQEDLARFGYTEADLAARKYDERFVHLMQFQAQRSHAFYSKAAALLPPDDRRAMRPAEIMRAVYYRLLRTMQTDSFRVFDHDYRVTRRQKVASVLTQFLPWW